MQIHRENAKEFTSAPHLRRVCEKHAGIHTTQIEPHSPWKNSDKQGVGMIKRNGAHLLRKTDAPPVLLEWVLYYEV